MMTVLLGALMRGFYTYQIDNNDDDGLTERTLIAKDNSVRSMEKKWISVLIRSAFYGAFIFLIACRSVPQQENQFDVLFIAYDQGESSAFLQIEKSLAAKGVSFRVLALGRGAAVYKDHSKALVLPEGINADALTYKRSGLLPPASLAAVTQGIQPRIVYTGMASAVQAQLANAFQQEGSAVIAFYDNFDTAVGNAGIRPFLDQIKHLDEIQAPTLETQKSLHHIPALKNTKVTLVGQPALEEWDAVFSEVDDALLRKRLHLAADDKVVLFAGGNLDEGYKQAFGQFVQAAARLPRVQFLVTWHPKFDGQFEAGVVRSANAKNIQLVGKDVGSTAQLCKLASVVATYQSTVGAKALYKGKPVIYIAGEDYNNFLINAGLAVRTSTVDTTVVALKQTLRKQKATVSLSPLGMPEKPSSVVTDRIVERLVN